MGTKQWQANITDKCGSCLYYIRHKKTARGNCYLTGRYKQRTDPKCKKFEEEEQMKDEIKRECEICGTDHADKYFKTDESDCVCDDCFIERADTTTSTLTSYFLDGYYIGSSEDMEGVFDTLCSFEGAKRLN